MTPPPLIHAMKMTRRTGRVIFLSLVFVKPEHVEVFKEKLRAALAPGVKKRGRFVIHQVEGRNDWLVEFKGAWPEDELDAHLKRIATEIGAEIYLEPGLPRSEIIETDPRSFTFGIDPQRRRPDNR